MGVGGGKRWGTSETGSEGNGTLRGWMPSSGLGLTLVSLEPRSSPHVDSYPYLYIEF